MPWQFGKNRYFLRFHHYVKSVRIRSFSGPYFAAFGLNTVRYRVSLLIQSKCAKIQVRKTSNTDTFHAVHCDSRIMFMNTGEGNWFFIFLTKFIDNFIAIALRHGCSAVNLLHIFRKTFPKNTSGGILMKSILSFILKHIAIYWHVSYVFNPLSAVPQNGQTHSNNSSAFADELFECVWPFCGVDV